MKRTTEQLWQLNKYMWMSLAFVLVYLPIARAQGLFIVPDWVAWALFGAAVADGAARSIVAWRAGRSLDGWVSILFNWLDILLIAGGIAITGGIASDLWLLYFVILIFESLYATRRQQQAITLLVAVVYLLAAWPVSQMIPHAPSVSVLFRLYASRVTFLYLVSALARRISANAAAQQRELLLLREQIATGEERARIAREVHDGLGHALVSVILRLELCARLMKKHPEEAEALLQEEIPALRAAWNEGRDLAFHLRPWETETGEESLTDVLRRHIGRFAERTGLTVELKTEGDSGTLSLASTFALTRIVQEALTNAARHAQATRIEVTLSYLPPRGLECVITDDGRGFEWKQAQNGMGMATMRERAEKLGGTLEVHSAPDAGTTLIVRLPE